MKDKKAFMKSVEAILTVLFFMGSYVYFTERVYTPTEGFQRNPARLGRVLLNSLDDTGLLEQDLKNHDMQGLENKMYYLMPDRLSYQVRANYFSKITLNSTGGTWDDSTNSTINHFGQTVSFSYNFPTHVDKNSIQVYSKQYSFDRNVDWDWFSVPVYLITNNTRFDGGVVEITPIKLKTNGGTVKNTSFAFQINDKLLVHNVTNLTEFSDDMNVTLKALLPPLPKNTRNKAFFYYAGGPTSYDASNAGLASDSLSVNASLTSAVSEPRNSSRGDVQFYVPLMNSSNEEFYLEYSIGTSETNDYNSTMNTTYDNTDVQFNYDKANREGTAPFYRDLPQANIYSVTRLVPLGDEHAQISLRMWYLW